MIQSFDACPAKEPSLERPRCRVPGAMASTVRVTSLLNSMPRCLLKSKGSLGGFLLSIVKKPSGNKNPLTSARDLAEGADRGVWPMPMPFPEEFRCGRAGASPCGWKKLVNLEVVVLSWLQLGCPAVAPSFIRLGQPLSRLQWNVVNQLRGLCVDSNTPEFVDAVAMGRAAGKFEDLEGTIAALSRAALDLHDDGRGYFSGAGSGQESDGLESPWRCGVAAGELTVETLVTAKPIDPSRLSFPGPPSFRPEKFFDARTAEIFRAPLDYAEDYEHYEQQVPKVKVNGSNQAKLDLFKMLAQSGRLRPVSLSRQRGPFVNGLFTVTKDSERDRLILDARPPNLLEEGRTHWCGSMASGATLVDICLRDDEALRFSGLDLRDYFYQFVITEQRTHRNILAGPICLEDAKYVFGPSFTWPEKELCVALGTLAMGDLSACEFAQASHLGLCLQGGVLCDAELISMRLPMPRQPVMIGIVIDDLVALEKVAFGLSPGGEEATLADERIEAALESYSAAGLEHNPKKSFRNVSSGKFWGIEIDGEKGLLRASSSRLWPLIFLTMRVALLGLSSVKLLECLAGCWVSILTVRRRMLCLLDIIFEPLGLPDGKQIIRLSPELCDELLAVAALGPIAVSDLRADFLPMVGASDASSDWMAAVRSEVNPVLAEEFGRHCLRRSNWSKLLPPGKAWLRAHDMLDPNDELPGECYDSHPLWCLLANCLTYRERWRQPCKFGQHINISELKAFLKEERLLSQSYLRKRFLFGLDSQVALGALVKGRAASRSLNYCLRCSLCYPLGSGLYQYLMYFPSSLNRSDGPTRGSAPAAPSELQPEWFEDGSLGNFEKFDEWLKGVVRGVVTPPFDCSDLMGGKPIELRPNSRTRMQPAKKVVEPEAPEEPLQTRSYGQVCCEDLSRVPLDQFITADGSSPDLSVPGALDLYSGSFGVARELLRHGAPWVLCYEWKRSSKEDLLNKENQSLIRKLLLGGAFGSLSMAPICASFSMAVTPPVRTLRHPAGKPGLSRIMRRKVKEGNEHCSFCCVLAEDAEKIQIVYMMENPDTSWFWRQRCSQRFRDPKGASLFRFAFCRFGTPWQKNTRIATNSRLAGLRMLCSCSQRHHALRGYSKVHKKSWTSVAEPYPAGLSKLIGAALAAKAGWCDNRALNIAACAKAGSARVGEAKNPGPIQRNFGPRSSLEELPGLTERTLAMESRLLDLFLRWCSSFLQSSSPSQVFDQVPSFLGSCLKRYADKMYQESGSLANLRHLILACQRWKPFCKAYTGVAWDMVRRWELQEPVTHRLPIPEGLLKALCTLGWMHGWFEWVAISLIAFYGGGRVGEVLRCRKFDLILPADTMEPDVRAAFLQLRTFKSRSRQPARIQHMKINDAYAVELLTKVYYLYEPQRILFYGTASQFRKRWDFLLRSLQVDREINLTPGGLRGGFAVWSYRKGVPISEILWQLRLRQQSTLESYLQEVGTLTVYSLLTPGARGRIERCKVLFQFLGAALPSQADTPLSIAT